MKRYRITTFSFDSRASTLQMEINPLLDPGVKNQMEVIKNQIRNGFQDEFGIVDFKQKEQNIIEIGTMFPSVVFFHNKFLEQIRRSFIIGSYYPAFTGVTTLTERILNHLIFELMDDFKLTPEYKKTYTKESFTDWDEMEKILTSWGILLPETKTLLRKLKKLRHQYAAHFNPETDVRDRELAIEAIKLFQEFIKIQFGSFGLQPWFIEKTKGEFFIKKEYETKPFIKKIYLPNCTLVGPKHEIVNSNGKFVIQDCEYEDVEISDSEFIKLREDFKNK